MTGIRSPGGASAVVAVLPEESSPVAHVEVAVRVAPAPGLLRDGEKSPEAKKLRRSFVSYSLIPSEFFEFLKCFVQLFQPERKRRIDAGGASHRNQRRNGGDA